MVDTDIDISEDMGQLSICAEIVDVTKIETGFTGQFEVTDIYPRCLISHPVKIDIPNYARQLVILILVLPCNLQQCFRLTLLFSYFLSMWQFRRINPSGYNAHVHVY